MLNYFFKKGKSQFFPNLYKKINKQIYIYIFSQTISLFFFLFSFFVQDKIFTLI